MLSIDLQKSMGYMYNVHTKSMNLWVCTLPTYNPALYL